MGVLIDEGYLANEHVTLEEVFTSPDYDSTWASVTKRLRRRPSRCRSSSHRRPGIGGAGGSGTRIPGLLLQALNFCWASSTRGSFSHANPSILAYILYELTGETPLEFATSTGARRPRHRARRLDLGAKRRRDRDVRVRNVRSAAQMAKLGQLYMQHGKSAQRQVVSRRGSPARRARTC